MEELLSNKSSACVICLEVLQHIRQGWNQRHLGIGIGALLPAEGLDDVDESPVVLDAALGTASLLLLLLLLLHLGSLMLDLTGTGQRSVHLTYNQDKTDQDTGQKQTSTHTMSQQQDNHEKKLDKSGGSYLREEGLSHQQWRRARKKQDLPQEVHQQRRASAPRQANSRGRRSSPANRQVRKNQQQAMWGKTIGKLTFNSAMLSAPVHSSTWVS